MSAVLDEPRIAYASRKVDRLREDLNTWRNEKSVLTDLVRDMNRASPDLLTYERAAVAAFASGADPAHRVIRILTSYRNVLKSWVDMGAELLRIASTSDPDAKAMEGLEELRSHLEEAKRTASVTPLELLFGALVRVWEEDNQYVSSTSQIVEHPAFRRIVELGDAVVPLLLAEVRRRPSHLVIALKRITDADPAAPEDRGKFRAMADAWVKWGEERKLI
jgi:hypothetical protein